jgi:hypothetical protein
MRLTRHAAALLALVTALCGGCGPASPPAVGRIAPQSVDATQQAQVALTSFLNSWQQRDWESANSLLTASRRFETTGEPESARLEQLASATPTPYSFDSVHQRPGDPEFVDARAFVAPVRFFGPELSVEPGERLDYMWILVRTRDGRWLVYDWGY